MGSTPRNQAANQANFFSGVFLFFTFFVSQISIPYHFHPNFSPPRPKPKPTFSKGSFFFPLGNSAPRFFHFYVPGLAEKTPIPPSFCFFVQTSKKIQEEKKNDPEKWIHKRNSRPERKKKKKRPREVDPQAKFETRKEEKKKRPREVDPQAKFETRKRSGSTSEI